jgi:zinc protease
VSNPNTHIIHFSNGLKTIFQQNNGAPVVTTQAWVHAGSADETKTQQGMAHVLEHMLFKGTKKYPGEKVANLIESNGGHINAFTSFDQTVYHQTITSSCLNIAIDTIAEMITHPIIAPESLESEKEVILEEIKRSSDSPGRVISNLLFSTAFPGHPYSNPIIGTNASVKSHTSATLKKFFKKWYAPHNITFIVIGDTTLDKLTKTIEKTFKTKECTPEHHEKKFKPIKRSRPPVKTQNVPKSSIKFKSINEAFIDISFPVPDINHPDSGAIDMFCAILGQGDTSHLYHDIKFTKQLVNDITTYSYTPKDSGIVIISVALHPKNLKKALVEITKKLVEFKYIVPSKEDIEKAKVNILSGHIFQQETVDGQARKLGLYYSMSNDLNFEKKYHKSIEDCTEENISDISHKYILLNKLNATFLLPNDLKKKHTPASLKKIIADTFKQEEKKQQLKAKKTKPSKRPLKKKGLMTDVVFHTLESGAKLILKPNPNVPIVAVRAAMLGGVRYENEKNNGTFALLSRMFTMGTKTKSAIEISNMIESKAASLGGYSGKNSFGLEGEFLTQYAHEGLELFADVFLNPTFPNPMFDNEKKNLLEYIRVNEDNPANCAFRLFSENLFKTHPYRFNILGTKESMSSLQQDDLVRTHKNLTSPNNLFISAVGDIDTSKAIDTFEDLFKDLPKTKDTAPPIPQEQGNFKEIIQHHELNRKQTHIVYGFNGTTISDKDRYVTDLIQAILSGQGGRLFVELRDKLSLAYSVFAVSMEGLEPGYIATYIACSPEKKALAVQKLKDELNKIKDCKISHKELTRAKKFLIGKQSIDLQKNSAQAFFLAYDELYKLGTGNTLRYADYINSVTHEDIKRVSEKYFNHDKSILVSVGPGKK